MVQCLIGLGSNLGDRVGNLLAAIEELRAAFGRYGLTRDEFLGARYLRIKQIQKLQREGLVDATLRWRSASAHSPIAVRL